MKLTKLSLKICQNSTITRVSEKTNNFSQICFKSIFRYFRKRESTQLCRNNPTFNKLLLSILASIMGGYQVHTKVCKLKCIITSSFRSPFLNLGLWSVCFYRFRHPKVQLDRIFHGCYPVWGENLQIISYWMAPGVVFITSFLSKRSLV